MASKFTTPQPLIDICVEQPPLARYDMNQRAKDEWKALIEQRKRRFLTKPTVEYALDSLALEPSCRFFMRDFQERKQRNDVWLGKPFYTHAKGYKMCLVVFANGIGEVQGQYVSVFVQLLEGEFDNDLPWPFQGSVTVLLLDTRFNRHIKHVISTVTPVRKKAAKKERRWGNSRFVPFGPRSWNSSVYDEGNCLHFEVSTVRVVI